MSDALKPPPYRPRPQEGETDREAPLTEEQLHDRESLIGAILIVMGMGALAGLALLVRELPGGGLPFAGPLARIPSVMFWLLALAYAIAVVGRHDRRRKLSILVAVLALVAALSGLGVALAHQRDPVQWTRDLETRFG
jgi:hypothetical protein